MFKQTWYEIKQPLFIKQMIWVAAFWVFTVTMILLNIHFLKTNYPNPVRPDDLILDIFPENKDFIAVGDLLSAIQVGAVVFIFLIWQNGIKGLPRLLFLLGLMYLIRAFSFNLTPLAQIQPPSENFPEQHIIAQTFYHGMYFSGHTASAFIQAMFFKGYRYQWIIFLLATGQAISLLLSHSHYSIDVHGGLFVAYFIAHFDWMRLVPSSLRSVKWMPWAA